MWEINKLRHRVTEHFSAVFTDKGEVLKIEFPGIWVIACLSTTRFSIQLSYEEQVYTCPTCHELNNLEFSKVTRARSVFYL